MFAQRIIKSSIASDACGNGAIISLVEFVTGIAGNKFHSVP